MLIRYQPGKKGAVGCAGFLYVIENGKFLFRNADALTGGEK